MEPSAGDPVLPFATPDAFERWLAKHHAKAAVVWIKHAKKASGEPSITWTEAVDIALCYGWIDGQSQALDERYYLQRYTPRRARSLWSKINRDRVGRLIASKHMQPAGLAEVERARADGRWDVAYDSPRTAEVPADLTLALARHPEAEASFATLDATNRYAILHRLMTVKKPETRARRIEAFVTMLGAGETLHPRSAKKPSQPKSGTAKLEKVAPTKVTPRGSRAR